MKFAPTSPTGTGDVGVQRSGARRSGARGRLRRWREGWTRRRTVVALVTLLIVTLVLPVPWLHVVTDDPIGHAWRLDGRLYVEGEPVEPPGRWSWLAVGRPPLVAELLWDRVVGTDEPPVDLRGGSRTSRPALSEPAAAAVGLRHAGFDVPMRLLVEASRPQVEGLPDRVVITEVAGVPLTDRAAWNRVAQTWQVQDGPLTGEPGPGDAEQPLFEPSPLEFAIRDGRSFSVPGPGLPYNRIDILDLAPLGLEASIAGPLARLAPVSWWRNLSLGSSHGMMVALLTYTDAAGADLAQTRHIAGTGGIRGDGSVTRIGGLPSKARAARRAGADVLLFPASQAAELETFDAQGMALVPVETLQDAITWLANPLT